MIATILKTTNKNGLTETLKLMYKLEIESILDSGFKAIVNKIVNSKLKFTLQDLENYVKENFTYKPDMYNETLILPQTLFTLKFGDCDDFSLFIKSFLSAINIKSNYILFGNEKNKFSHIANYIPIQNNFYKDCILDSTNYSGINTLDLYKYHKIIR